MRKRRGEQVNLRIDSHVLAYLLTMPGDNNCEKIRYLINYGIQYRDWMSKLMTSALNVDKEEVPND